MLPTSKLSHQHPQIVTTIFRNQFYNPGSNIQTIFRRIYSYSAASTSQAAYIIGGAETSNVIAEFRNDSWRLMNNLYRGREAHGSIALGNKIMVIGGYGDNNK